MATPSGGSPAILLQGRITDPIEPMRTANIDQYFLLGGQLDQMDWRTFEPEDLVEKVAVHVRRRLNA